MKQVKKHDIRAVVRAAAAILLTLCAVFPCRASEADKQPITVALYMLPQKAHFQEVVETKWAELHPDIPLEITFPEHPYHDPSFLSADVFAYDTDMLTYVAEKGAAMELSPEDLPVYNDLIGFVRDGIAYEGKYYAIPFAICNSCMLCDRTDLALSNARTFREAAELILEDPSGGCMAIDFFGDIAYHFMHVFYSVNGSDAVPDLYNVDDETAETLLDMALLEKAYKETAGEVPKSQKKRAEHYDTGLVRALYCYSEDSAKLMTRTDPSIRFFGYGSENDGRPFYCDAVSVNADIEDPGRRALCLELANMIAGEEVFRDYICVDGACLNVLPASETLFLSLADEYAVYRAVWDAICDGENFIERPGSYVYDITNEGKQILTDFVNTLLEEYEAVENAA
ncbi:MAG: hypothetical protein Q4G19_09245 [Clostridia bacterium]|nr:hypothetical protein [Clostridia bacterium]